jgi:hypothetical protein
MITAPTYPAHTIINISPPKLVTVWDGFSDLKSGYAAPKPIPIDTTPGTSKNISTIESAIIKGVTLSKIFVAMIQQG